MVGLEEDAALCRHAQGALADAANAKIVAGPFLAGWPSAGPYDAIVLEGATEVVPETFEASLMLVSQVLMLLQVPVSRVVRTVGEIRNRRYATLRSIVARDGEAWSKGRQSHSG